MDDFLSGMVVALILLILVLAGIMLVSWLVMLGWNFLAAYFGFKLITYWVSVIIVIILAAISSIFFHR